MLSKLDFQYDVSRLLPLLDTVVWDSKNRCDLNKPTGHWLYDPYVIVDRWKGTLFEDILESIPMPIGEARLMRLARGTCYSSHADIDDRFHLNLVSNDQSYLIDLENHIMHQLHTDNNFYVMDAGRLHIAANFGSTDRIQLVIRKPLVRIDDPGFIRRKIKFINPVFNLRYIFDNHLSTLLNRAVKQQKVGFFNPFSDLEIEFVIDPYTLEQLLNKLISLNIEFKVEE
jgi:hypothetical protein